MKSIIIYGSHHHGSTEKLVKAIAKEYPVDLLDAEGESTAALEEYDLIGGMNKDHPSREEMENALSFYKELLSEKRSRSIR